MVQKVHLNTLYKYNDDDEIKSLHIKFPQMI